MDIRENKQSEVLIPLIIIRKLVVLSLSELFVRSWAMIPPWAGPKPGRNPKIPPVVPPNMMFFKLFLSNSISTNGFW